MPQLRTTGNNDSYGREYSQGQAGSDSLGVALGRLLVLRISGGSSHEPHITAAYDVIEKLQTLKFFAMARNYIIDISIIGI